MEFVKIVVVIMCFLQHVTSQDQYACESAIYCQGPILRAVQMAMLYNDSKTFVDMAMKEDPDVILQAFKDLQKEHKTDTAQFEVLQLFMDQYFTGPGTELEEHIPEDWTERPEGFSKITDGQLRQWAYDLNALWKDLSRKIKKDVGENPERYSLLYVPHPFVVPGDRFREFYYWDSYWVIQGLLLSGMTDTARHMINNMLYMVDRYGHVPNGGRVYYVQRSQPPLLIHMVDAYYQHTRDKEFVRENIQLLEKEYSFWLLNRSLTVVDATGQKRNVARYVVPLTTPRPEGYLHDVQLAENLPDKEKSKLYMNLASAAESGWDFSSRWFNDKTKMSSIHTVDVVPVDLNVYLQRNEYMLAQFYDMLGNLDKASEFRAAAQDRWAAVDALLWQEQLGTWCDHDLGTSQHVVECNFYPSNVFPLLMLGKTPKYWPDRKEKVMAYLETDGVLGYPGGVPTSLIPSGQQWDFPNAWAPLVHLLVEALEAGGNSTAARELAQTWVTANHQAWVHSGHMLEKYDVENPGEAGGGGEYSIQTGFGWSNAVILILLDKYADQLTVPEVPRHGFSTEGIVCLVLVGFIVTLIVLGMVMYQRNKLLHRKLPPGLGPGAFSISEHSNAVYHPVTEPSVQSGASSPGVTYRRSTSAAQRKSKS